MKQMIFNMALAVIVFTACNNDNKEKTTVDKKADTTQAAPTQTSQAKPATSTSDIIGGYLQLKNALAGDDATAAGFAAKSISGAIAGLDKTTIPSDKKKIYDDIEADMKEHAEHIAGSTGKIDHQREHFEMLSKDMYDLVKTFGGGRLLYKDYCPMYNNGKGATWLSEVKEIKNPYLGKSMLTCGSVKEELK